MATLLIMTARWRTMPALLRLALTGQSRRARTLLVALAGTMHCPESYTEWVSCFDTWPTRPPAGVSGASVAALVFQQ